ncbi:MAG: methyl-accepting chemotaxis protein [Selenomonadaceae bacterium]|nr:methyl-accepting chemotaxis protein [Selenomonadaceae bacterium]
MKLTNVKLTVKLAAYVVIAAVVMLAIGVTGYQSLRQSQSNMELYEQRVTAERALAGEQLVIRKMQIAMLDSAVARPDVETKLTPYEKQRKHVLEANEGNIKEFEKYWTDYKAVAPSKADIQQGIAQSEKDWAAYRDAIKCCDDLLLAGDQKAAMEQYVGPVKEATTAVKKDLGELEKDTLVDMTAVQEANEAELGRAVRNMTLVTLIGIVILSVFTWWIVREIRTPLLQMIAVCRRFYACDFRAADMPTQRRDEFGEMAASLEQMRQRLAGLLAQIQASSEKVTHSAGTLAQTSMQSAEASSQIASAVSQAASLVDEQQQAVDGSLSSMQQVAATMDHMHSETDKTTANSGQARDKAVQGGKSIAASTQEMAQVRDAVQSSATLVDKLGQRSDEIGRIVDTIAEIAEQTNLLALNAAIEAARAGEQGRGFAVVAENVRKLAEQSQGAAQQIGEMIRSIQTDTEQAVQAMEAGRIRVEEGTQHVQQLQAVFTDIEKLVVTTAAQAGTMAESAAEAAHEVESASQAGRRVQEHGTQVADEMQSVSAAAEEQSASAEEVAAASENLTKLAEELHQAIAAFKY